MVVQEAGKGVGVHEEAGDGVRDEACAPLLLDADDEIPDEVPARHRHGQLRAWTRRPVRVTQINSIHEHVRGVRPGDRRCSGAHSRVEKPNTSVDVPSSASSELAGHKRPCADSRKATTA